MASLHDMAPYIIEQCGDHYRGPDTVNERFCLDLATPSGSFCAVAQAIMYALPTSPHYAEDTIAAIVQQDDYPAWFNTQLLAQHYEGIAHLRYRERLHQVQRASPLLYAVVDKHYRRIPSVVTLNILKAAKKIEEHSKGDLSQLYSICGHDGRKVVQTMMDWSVRLQIKAFWVAREMRARNVWVNRAGRLIDGEFCCVVDIQVERALKCLGVLDESADLFAKSKQVWSAFGEHYDLPLLWLARTYCSKRSSLACPMRLRGCGAVERRTAGPIEGTPRSAAAKAGASAHRSSDCRIDKDGVGGRIQLAPNSARVL